MFCYKSYIVSLAVASRIELTNHEMEYISTDCLAYCNACLSMQKRKHEEVFSYTGNLYIHDIMKVIYYLLNSINDFIEYFDANKAILNTNNGVLDDHIRDFILEISKKYNNIHDKLDWLH